MYFTVVLEMLVPSLLLPWRKFWGSSLSLCSMVQFGFSTAGLATDRLRLLMGVDDVSREIIITSIYVQQSRVATVPQTTYGFDKGCGCFSRWALMYVRISRHNNLQRLLRESGLCGDSWRDTVLLEFPYTRTLCARDGRHVRDAVGLLQNCRRTAAAKYSLTWDGFLA